MALNLVSNRKNLTRLFLLVLIFLAVLNALINILGLGGDEFVITLNNSFVIVLSIGITVVSVIIMGQLVVENRKRSQWLGMLIGWGLWSLGEIIWAGLSYTNQEIPYPSWADLFWLIGYLPIGISLVSHIRGLLIKPNRLQKVAIWIFSFITILVTVVYVMIPILRDYEPGLLIETVINLLFLVFDLTILVMALVIIFSPQKGVYGHSWIWLSIGFALHSFSNNVFLFADYNGLYYPDLKINFLSSMVIDYSYNLSYLLWFTGVLVLRGLLKEYEHFTVDSRLRSIPNTNVLIFTDNKGIIMHSSENAYDIFPFVEGDKKIASEALGTTEADLSNYLKSIDENNLLPERKIQVTNRDGTQLDAWISGLGIRNPQKEFTGAIFLIRVFASLGASLKGFSEYQQTIFDNLLTQLGSNSEGQVKQMLLDYYYTFLKAIFDRSVVEGGVAMSDAFQAELQTTAKSNGFQIEFEQNGLHETSPQTLEELKTALPVLFATARQFMVNRTSELLASLLVKEVYARIDPAIHESVERYGVLISN